jgi:hypothetical protein
MVTKDRKADKPKAQRADLNTLVVDAAYVRTFSSGKAGFFGKVTDPRTGDKYQIIGAVKIG